MECSLSPEAGHTELSPGPAGVPGHGGDWAGTASPQVSQSHSQQEDCRGEVIDVCSCIGESNAHVVFSL